MRPIVSGYDSCTAKLSEFLDSFLKYQAQRCKSYIKDTKDFLIKLRSFKSIPTNCILVTMDVSSLYTNIDQLEGAEACFQKLEERKRKNIPSILLKNLILLVLKCNILRFGSTLYSQSKGTCMGTPMAPNYANLFMDKFEQNLLVDYHKKTGKKPLVWWRYIDDIFCLWTDGEESLKDFIQFTQNYSEQKKLKSKIKFTVNHSTSEVNFLDVCVRLKDGNICTTTYSKPTDSHLYLNTQSNHPSHIIRNIPKSQFLRLRRICSNTADFMQQCSTYVKYFAYRGYNETKLAETVREVTKINRDDLLQSPSNKTVSNRVIFSCNWHPLLVQLPNILKRHFYLLQNDKKLRHIFTEVPMVAFRRARTIRNEIVRSDMNPPQTLKDSTSPCTTCKSTCHLICQAGTITNNKTGKSVNITTGGNCKTSDIIYAARCKICDLIYVGESKEELRSRFSKHRYDVNNRPDNNELTKHVHAHNHDFEKDVEVVILKQGFKSSAERKFFEDKFICILGTIAPNGLNVDMGNYAKEMYTMHQD